MLYRADSLLFTNGSALLKPERVDIRTRRTRSRSQSGGFTNVRVRFLEKMCVCIAIFLIQTLRIMPASLKTANDCLILLGGHHKDMRTYLRGNDMIDGLALVFNFKLISEVRSVFLWQ